jgi:hypothetical protein
MHCSSSSYLSILVALGEKPDGRIKCSGKAASTEFLTRLKIRAFRTRPFRRTRTRTQTEVRNSDSDPDSGSDLRNRDFPTP